MQFRIEYGIHGSTKNIRNSVSSEFRKHPSTDVKSGASGASGGSDADGGSGAGGGSGPMAAQAPVAAETPVAAEAPVAETTES